MQPQDVSLSFTNRDSEYKLYVAPSSYCSIIYNLNIFLCRWEKYTPCGNQIGDSPFIAFKVPLNPVRYH